MNQQDKDRVAFESFMSGDGKLPEAIEKDANGTYVLMATAFAWHIWHTAIAHERQQRNDIDYKSMYEKMCERCDALDAELAKYEQKRGEPPCDT